jgi:hypothetical protein
MSATDPFEAARLGHFRLPGDCNRKQLPRLRDGWNGPAT